MKKKDEKCTEKVFSAPYFHNKPVEIINPIKFAILYIINC